MKSPSYRDQDYAFGQRMLSLRSKIGLTQSDLADMLGVSRRSVGSWEAGSKYPKPEHLQHFITLAVERRAFPAGKEAGEIRVLWQQSQQKVLLDEQWLADLLMLTEQDNDPAMLSIRMRALHRSGWLAADQHDFDEAMRLFEQSANLRRALGETVSETASLINAGLQARAEGQYQPATMLLEDALSQLRAQGDRGGLSTGGIGYALYALALICREQGEFDRASALFTECIEFHQAIGEREGVAQSQLGLSDVARDIGNPAMVRHYSDTSLEIFHEFETQWAIGFTLNNLAQASYQEGDFDQALAFVQDSIALFRSINNESGLAEVLITQGYIQLARQELAAAHDTMVEALRFAWTLGPRLMVAAALEALAAVMAESGSLRSAIRCLAASSVMRSEMGTPVRLVDRPVLERTQARLQSELEISDLALAWSEAGSLPPEQLVQAVIGEAQDMHLPAEPAPISHSTTSAPVQAQLQQSKAAPNPQCDWNDAPRISNFYGREWELDTLREWIIDEDCQVVTLLGLGGIGKSTLAVNVMHRLANQFEVVIWRSLQDIPTCSVLSSDLVQVLIPDAPSEATATFELRINLLLEVMRKRRVLMVLDNVEAILEEGEGIGVILPDYEGFDRFLRLVASTKHQSCVLLTSREKPDALVPYEGSNAPVRALRLAQLNAEACNQLLSERGVVGSAEECRTLIEAYAGNPLALRIVSRTIVDLFNGELAPFLAQGEVIFGGIRDLLGQQFNRLSALEQSLMLWLAILREPATLDDLLTLQVTPVPGARLLEAIEALHRRSLVERGHRPGSFTLQSVVMEYVTTRLVTDAVTEINQGKLNRLLEHGLELAHAREYVRHTQERLIIAATLVGLRNAQPHEAAIEDMLRELLDQLRRQPQKSQGYGPANLIALLRYLRGDLRGLDLSHLLLRNAYLQGVDMQDASLAGAVLQDSIFSESFGIVTAVAVSSSGKYWATASKRGEIRVWEAEGLVLHLAWRAHDDMVWSLAFSSDESTLASASWDETLKVWDIASGALRWSGRHTSHINRVCFSPSGKLLASGANDATVQLWDADTGTALQTLSQPDAVTSLAWSPDEQYIATGDLKGSVRLWAVDDHEPLHCVFLLTDHHNCVEGLAFSPDSSHLASASWDHTVKLWEVSTGRLIKTLAGHTDRVFRVAWSPDNRILASGGRDQTIALWDIEKGSYHAMLRGHHSGLSGLVFTPDSQRLLSGSEDGTLRVWDMANGECVRIIQGYATSLYDVDWSPDGRHLVGSSTDYLVTIYSVNGEEAPRVFSGHTGVVYGVGWSADGQWLASSEWDNAIYLWKTTTGEKRYVRLSPDDPDNYFYGLAWSPDGLRLAGGTYRQGVLVWDWATQRLCWDGQAVSSWIRTVAWSPDGNLLAGGGDDGVVYLVDANDGRLLHRLEGHLSMVTSLAWNSDGTGLASSSRGTAGNNLILWDIKRRKRLTTFEGQSTMIFAVVWGAGDKQLISANGNGTLYWWDVHSGACLRTRQAHQGAIHALRRSPDGTLLASCGDDGAIMLWDNASGEHHQTLRRDRPYERLNIHGVSGLTEAQTATLRALGAIDRKP
ncbi:MAG: tetratricopeptide repeat protein [Anaerolineae bacterium]|nr:tetratricopeptide repeat protein [Anaerolineae bacterium]